MQHHDYATSKIDKTDACSFLVCQLGPVFGMDEPLPRTTRLPVEILGGRKVIELDPLTGVLVREFSLSDEGADGDGAAQSSAW